MRTWTLQACFLVLVSLPGGCYFELKSENERLKAELLELEAEVERREEEKRQLAVELLEKQTELAAFDDEFERVHAQVLKAEKDLENLRGKAAVQDDLIEGKERELLELRKRRSRIALRNSEIRDDYLRRMAALTSKKQALEKANEAAEDRIREIYHLMKGTQSEPTEHPASGN